MNSDISVADLLGPWADPNFESSLIARCKGAWHKPLHSLSNQELATFLRQRIAVSHLLPIAQERAQNSVDDDTEIYEGELEAAIEYAKHQA